MACPTYSGLGTAVVDQIETQLDKVNTISTNALIDLENALIGLRSAAITAVDNIDRLPSVQEVEQVNFTFNPTGEPMPFTFYTPDVEGLNERYEVGYEAPSTLTNSTLPVFTTSPPPFINVARPNPQLPTVPLEVVNPTIPSPPVRPTDLTVGDAPEIYAPNRIDLYTPDIAAITAMLDAILADLPSDNWVITASGKLQAFADGAFQGVEAWVDSKLTAPDVDYQTALRGILEATNDRIGLPVAVETAMRERAFNTEDRLAFQAERTLIEDWLSRGFTLPGGAVDSRLLAVRQQAWDKKGAINRDVFVESAKIKVDLLMKSIQVGADLEMKYWDNYARMTQIAVAVEEAKLKAFEQVLSAAIETFKSYVGLWQAQLGSVGELTKLELAKFEVNKGLLENEKLQVEASGLAMQAFKTEAEVVQIRAGVYDTQVKAFAAHVQAIAQIYDVYKTRVQAFSAGVQAYTAQWGAYESELRSEATKQQAYGSAVQAFGERVKAYAAEMDASKSLESFKMDAEKLNQQSWLARLDALKTRVQVDLDVIKTRFQAWSGDVDLYKVSVEGQKMDLDTRMKTSDINTRNVLQQQELTLRRADMEIQKALEVSKIAIGVYDGLSRASSQLAAGAMSAMNMGASMSYGNTQSQSIGCSETYNYSE